LAIEFPWSGLLERSNGREPAIFYAGADGVLEISRKTSWEKIGLRRFIEVHEGGDRRDQQSDRLQPVSKIPSSPRITGRGLG